MLQVSYIRENKEDVIAGLRKRAWSDERISVLDEVISTDNIRKEQKTELDTLYASVNTISGQIGKLFKEGKREEAEAQKAEVSSIKERSKVVEDSLKETESKLAELLYTIPNVPDAKVPAGASTGNC